jgi:hypothetical protein
MPGVKLQQQQQQQQQQRMFFDSAFPGCVTCTHHAMQ